MRMLRTILLLAIFVLSATLPVIGKERQTREEYVERYKAIAIAHMERYGIPASITMAQGILESDSGNSTLSTSSNNHFGIKCKKSWRGDRVFHDDDAKGECFRAYPSVEASYQDHADFLDQSPRYDSLFAYPSDDYRSWARGLKACGYATAPDYAERLIKIIESMKLYLLDKENGGKIYMAAKRATANTEGWFESNTASPDEQINPNAFRVTVNSHKGYGIYRSNHTFYVVAKEGDTYQKIGEVFHISARTLEKFNDVAKGAQLNKGDIVYIERKKTQWLGNVMQHKVVRDENLYALSQSYGIRLKSLMKLNHLREGTDVKKGEIIRLK
ncbi:MAG: glucosaminidase domain-containing protein [Alistipes sp.]|nr:glucosaminidase domain-containing protein [Alistipes sp.]